MNLTKEDEIANLDESMKNEIKQIKDKYSDLKKEVRLKYKKIEHKQKKNKPVRKSIPKSLKSLVWDRNVGKEKGVGPCFVCNISIDSKNFECGHIKSINDGGLTNIDNLKPICGCCNKSMGTQNLNEFKILYFKKENKGIPSPSTSGIKANPYLPGNQHHLSEDQRNLMIWHLEQKANDFPQQGEGSLMRWRLEQQIKDLSQQREVV